MKTVTDGHGHAAYHNKQSW